MHLAGLSGGAWTTSMVAAMDPRIRLSVQVAGRLGDRVAWEEKTWCMVYGLGGFISVYGVFIGFSVIFYGFLGFFHGFIFAQGRCLSRNPSDDRCGRFGRSTNLVPLF